LYHEVGDDSGEFGAECERSDAGELQACFNLRKGAEGSAAGDREAWFGFTKHLCVALTTLALPAGSTMCPTSALMDIELVNHRLLCVDMAKPIRCTVGTIYIRGSSIWD
jgi:hypothetical protein